MKPVSFSSQFFSEILNGSSVEDAFQITREQKLISNQNPQISGFDENSDVFILYKSIPLPRVPIISGPEINDCSLPGPDSVEISVQVKYVGSEGNVWASIYIEDNVPYTQLELTPHPEKKITYEETTYTTCYNFPQPGDYILIFDAKNEYGFAKPLVEPFFFCGTLDVNEDETVDILDLISVGQQFGEKTGAADVNGDGIVDISDLVLIGVHLGESCGQK